MVNSGLIVGPALHTWWLNSWGITVVVNPVVAWLVSHGQVVIVVNGWCVMGLSHDG